MATEPATEPVQNGAPVRGKRRTGDWQEYLVLVLLTAAYSIGGGFINTPGLLQASWMQTQNITDAEASLISSVSYCTMLLPASPVQILIQHLDVPPSAILASAVGLLSAGLVVSSQATTVAQLVVGNGLLVSFAVCLVMLFIWKSMYLFFTDRQIYLYNSIIATGSGIGMILIAGMFSQLLSVIGWRKIQLMELAFAAMLLLISGVFLPPMVRILGIRTRHESNQSDTSERTPPHHEPVVEDCYDEPRQSHLSGISTLVFLLTNVKYLFLLASFVLAECTFNVILTHEPTRMVYLGYNIEMGARSLVIQGVIQIVVRLVVGVLTGRGYALPERISEVSKLVFVMVIVLCTTFKQYQVQMFFLSSIGAVGAVVSTTDVMMVKDATPVGRELGLTLFMLFEGLGTLLLVYLVGYLHQVWRGYTIQFYSLSGLSVASFALMVAYRNSHPPRYTPIP